MENNVSYRMKRNEKHRRILLFLYFVFVFFFSIRTFLVSCSWFCSWDWFIIIVLHLYTVLGYKTKNVFNFVYSLFTDSDWNYDFFQKKQPSAPHKAHWGSIRRTPTLSCFTNRLQCDCKKSKRVTAAIFRSYVECNGNPLTIL